MLQYNRYKEEEEEEEEKKKKKKKKIHELRTIIYAMYNLM